MKRLARILALLILVVGTLVSFQLQAQAVPTTSPLLAQARMNAADVKLTTEFGQFIDLNNTDIRHFRQIRGMYPNLAAKIIKNAPYEKVEDVLDIPGLSDSQKQRLQANLDKFTVTSPSNELIQGDDRINPGVY